MQKSGKHIIITLLTKEGKMSNQQNNPYINKLSEMEIEHLNTKASIPYRDPTGEMLSKEILEIREKEQQFSKLLNTNSWRKKWEMA